MVTQDVLIENIDSSLLHEKSLKNLIVSYLKKINHLSKADITVLYLRGSETDKSFRGFIKIGHHEIPKNFSCKETVVDFLHESGEIIFLTEKKESLFLKILLNKDMQSGIAIPLTEEDFLYGIVFINFTERFLSNKKTVYLIEKFRKIMDELLNKNEIKKELKNLKNKITI
jgi:transcriptional regulator with GAF, ATPase, and Fis domain